MTQTAKANAINWFEIPVVDMERAVRFYETVLDLQLRRETFMDEPHAIFPSAGGVTGALVKSRLNPGGAGTRIYLNAPELDAALGRVEKAGGQVHLGRTDIGDPGFIAIIADSEGNAVGLHTERR